ncbi:MAG: DUF624 domain-containing protein [Rubrobacteraceae bacterium]|uniref:YesL family protein n=1 Tax=Rubrobacter calidifluminis TaxID=1392640 RepID=UPI002361CD91|nr:DUF624 domain-containing protein [Rubrobacter calidifluminis]MCL6439599.1 DUF624 domain-containing protein [Rubrobacteraceae bacterium]
MNMLESRWYRALEVCANFLYLNLLWLVCSVPIITLPASMAAMFGVVREWVKGREPGVTGSFFSFFRENFRQSTWIGFLWALVGVILAVDFAVVRGMGSPVSEILYVVLFVVCFLYVFTLVYIFPVIVNFEARWSLVIRNALLFSMTGPLVTLACLLVLILAAAAFVFFPLSIFVSGSVGSYLVYRLCERTFERVERIRGRNGEDR